MLKKGNGWDRCHPNFEKFHKAQPPKEADPLSDRILDVPPEGPEGT